MIYLGLDDTDTVGTRGTNHVARELVGRLGFEQRAATVARHQLLFDARIPYTSGNGSASIVLADADPADAGAIHAAARALLLEWFIVGSDPGLCVTAQVPDAVVLFALRCQNEIVDQGEARALAAREGICLEGLGGTEGGVIGALAAVGLARTGDDGRVVHRAGWPWPDDFRGLVEAAAVRARGVDAIVRMGSGEEVGEGVVDVGKRLRPNLRGGRVVVFVEPAPEGSAAAWRAVRLY